MDRDRYVERYVHVATDRMALPYALHVIYALFLNYYKLNQILDND